MTMSDDQHLSLSSSGAVKHRRIRTLSLSPQFQQLSEASVDSNSSTRFGQSWFFNGGKSVIHNAFNKAAKRQRPWYSYWCRRTGGRVFLLFLLALLSSPLCLIYTIRYCCQHQERQYLLKQSSFQNAQNGHYLVSDYPHMVAWTRNGGYSAASWPKKNHTATAAAASDLQSRLVRMRRVVIPMSDPELQKHILLHSSFDREMGRMTEFETNDCQAQWDWQKQSIPTCNPIHEVEMTNPITLLQHQQHHDVGNDDDSRNHPLYNNHTDTHNDADESLLRLVANGYWRDVWIVNASSQQDAVAQVFVLKTIRYQHPFIPRNFDRHRRDAMVMERLTSSPYIVNIYAFCGNSGAFEYADGGDITTSLWPLVQQMVVHNQHVAKRVPANLTSLERFQIGLQAAMGVAAMHNVDQEGRASIAHTDISPTQFVKINNRYKLNDFNRARFLTWNTTSQKLCSYQIQQNPGKNRSPEEYNYEPQTEKVDVFSLGNIFYMLLMLELPFQGLPPKEAAEKIKMGERPSFYADVWDSPDPYIQALKTAMIMCHQHNVTERATARQVETFLQDKLREIETESFHSLERESF